jgi:hypothetical protein
MIKIVINTDCGGYSLSELACKELGLNPKSHGYEYSDDRANPKLVKVVEKLGDLANGHAAHLKVIEIPNDVKWRITEHDGWESVYDIKRFWN